MNKVTPRAVTRAGSQSTSTSVATCRTTGQEQVGQWHGASSSRTFLPSWFDVGSAEIHLNSRDTTGGFPLPQLPERSQPHPKRTDKGNKSTHFSTTFLLFRMRCSSADVWGPCSFCPFNISFSSCSID